jgi:hypothetical protein
MDFLPPGEDRPAAPPIGKIDPTAYGDTPDESAEATAIPFEWGTFDAPGVPAAAAAPGDVGEPVATMGPSSRTVQPDRASLDRTRPPETLAPAEAGGDAPVTPRFFDVAPAAAASEPDAPTGHYELDFLVEERGTSDGEQLFMPVEAPPQAAPIGASAGETPKRDQPIPAGTRMGTRQLAMVGGGVIAAGALIFTILGMRGAASPEPAAAPAPVRRAPANTAARSKPAPAAAVKPVKVDADAPRWSRVNDGRWVGTRGQTAAFELPATGRVHVWMRDVTPVLVVRCEKGNAEAFVYTQSAARMEPQDGDHTVQVSFDGAGASSERWPDSAEHDALFARNPQEFTRQMTQSRTLQFGFTPHNAEPIVATFVLDGLEPLLASSAKQCGWKR